MPTVWNADRWTDAGYNEAGDRVYERNTSSNVSGAAAKSSSTMTKAELQEIAAARGMPTSGTKDQLIDRLAGVEGS